MILRWTGERRVEVEVDCLTLYPAPYRLGRMYLNNDAAASASAAGDGVAAAAVAVGAADAAAGGTSRGLWD